MIIQLQADFDTFMKNLLKDKYSYKVLLSNYANKFIEEWPIYVDAIINICKKLKTTEIKNFLNFYCFKVLIALHSFPYSCQHIRNFTKKLIYKIAPSKIYTKVNNFIKDINLYKKTNDQGNSSLEISIESET